eukprot:247460_1
MKRRRISTVSLSKFLNKPTLPAQTDIATPAIGATHLTVSVWVSLCVWVGASTHWIVLGCLLLFSAVSVAHNIEWSPVIFITSTVRPLLSLFGGTLILFLAAILLGTPIRYAESAVSLAAIVTCLSFVPVGCVLGADSAKWWKAISATGSDARELHTCIPAACALFGAWLGSFALSLDWQCDWLIFPLPSLYFATAMFSVSSLISCCFIVFNMCFRDQSKDS